jgi:hypothetical protein
MILESLLKNVKEAKRFIATVKTKKAESDDKKDKGVPSLFYQQTLESVLDGMNDVRSVKDSGVRI